jgi:hypothetical protein
MAMLVMTMPASLIKRKRGPQLRRFFLVEAHIKPRNMSREAKNPTTPTGSHRALDALLARTKYSTQITGLSFDRRFASIMTSLTPV